MKHSRVSHATKSQKGAVPPMEQKRESATPGFELRPLNQCPSAEDIAKMIKAMAELDRLGASSYAIFQIPVGFAVWVFGLVRWCTGVPPSVRVPTDKPPKTMGAWQYAVNQPESKITVDLVE